MGYELFSVFVHDFCQDSYSINLFKEINKDYNGRIGSIDFCGTDFSALDYFERYVLYADFALPKTMQIFDEAMIFWNLLCQEIPLLMNSSLDFSAALIPDM